MPAATKVAIKLVSIATDGHVLVTCDFAELFRRFPAEVMNQLFDKLEYCSDIYPTLPPGADSCHVTMDSTRVEFVLPKALLEAAGINVPSNLPST